MKKSNNQKNKRQKYTNEQKLEVIEYKEKFPDTTVDALIIKFKMSKGTISATLNKNIHKIKAACSKNRSVKTIKECEARDKIYSALFEWFTHKRMKIIS